MRHKRQFEDAMQRYPAEIKRGYSGLALPQLKRGILTITNRYCQAAGWYDVVENHKKYSPVDNLRRGKAI